MQDSELRRAAIESRNRLHPSIRNPSWLVLRKRREIFTRWVNTLPPGRLMVLDVGGRLQPYRQLLDDRIQRYTSVDIKRTPLVDVIARGEQLPFASDTFDVVICTQVLEYVAEPESVTSEIHRVLRRGGTLILSVPAAHVRDADEECWSFHPAGIRKLLARYSDARVEPEGGSISGFFRTINVCLDIFAKYGPIRFIFRLTLCPFFNLLGFCLESVAGSSNDQFTVNYSALARKAD